MSDTRINEGAERLYDRAREHGATHAEALRRVGHARDNVSRRCEDGRVIHPSDRKGSK